MRFVLPMAFLSLLLLGGATAAFPQSEPSTLFETYADTRYAVV